MIIEVRDLYFTYPDGDSRKVILNHVNVSFEKGKFYTILGESGSGKTTFLSLIAALDKPEGGEILYEGESIETIGYERYRRNNIGIVFQSYNLIPYMNALENVMVAMSITDNKMDKELKAKALEILSSVGIDGSKATRRINRLSGGEQQRVAIARAMMNAPKVLFADEPTAALDHETAFAVMDILKEYAKDNLVIVITHDHSILKDADLTIEMWDGMVSFVKEGGV